MAEDIWIRLQKSAPFVISTAVLQAGFGLGHPAARF
jgi:hypothetical protein